MLAGLCEPPRTTSPAGSVPAWRLSYGWLWNQPRPSSTNTVGDVLFAPCHKGVISALKAEDNEDFLHIIH